MKKNIVIIAEKPSQARAYTEAFESVEKKEGYFIVSNNIFSNAIITYGFGHLVQLCSPDQYDEKLKKWKLEDLPIIPGEFKFEVSDNKIKQFKIVKKLLDQADEIIVATDVDREGEAIARQIINHSKNSHKIIKRLWINSLEIDEIKKGFKNLREGEEFFYSYKEAESRQFADWLVGMNLSRLYTLLMNKNGINGVFSIGRVQTPTLFLIYKRNEEIENFISRPFFEITSVFNHKNGIYNGKYENKFDNKNNALDFINENNLEQGNGIISEINTVEKKEYPGKLFSLSDLQSKINKDYGYSASETLDIVQKLYEKKYISYPRTDCNFIGEPEFKYLIDNLSKYLNIVDESIEQPILEANKRYVNSTKVQEHYAIIPTRIIPNLNQLSEQELVVYRTILYRTIAIFEKPHIYNETVILTKINNVEFKSKGKVEIQRGFKKLFLDEKDEDKNEKLPKMEQGDSVNSKIEITEGKTTPPKFYTEGTLLSAMKNVGKMIDDEENKELLKETEGIGTEATRSGIIETLKHQKYIELDKKNIIVTEKGKILCKTLEGVEITDVELTAKWEKYLKKIREKSGSQKVFLESINRFVNHLVNTSDKIFENDSIKEQAQKIEKENTVGKCPNCSQSIVDKGNFFGCVGYPGCKFTLAKDFRKKKLTSKNIKELLEKKETIVEKIKSKDKKTYNALVKMNEKNCLEFVEFKK